MKDNTKGSNKCRVIGSVSPEAIESIEASNLALERRLAKKNRKVQQRKNPYPRRRFKKRNTNLTYNPFRDILKEA